MTVHSDIFAMVAMTVHAEIIDMVPNAYQAMTVHAEIIAISWEPFKR